MMNNEEKTLRFKISNIILNQIYYKILQPKYQVPGVNQNK